MDDLTKDLDKFAKRVHNFAGEHKVSFGELFTNSFMQKYTTFANINDFFNAVGIKDSKDFDAYPQAKLDTFVAQHSQFANFAKMQSKATDEYINHQLGF